MSDSDRQHTHTHRTLHTLTFSVPNNKIIHSFLIWLPESSSQNNNNLHDSSFVKHGILFHLLYYYYYYFIIIVVVVVFSPHFIFDPNVWRKRKKTQPTGQSYIMVGRLLFSLVIHWVPTIPLPLVIENIIWFFDDAPFLSSINHPLSTDPV